MRGVGADLDVRVLGPVEVRVGETVDVGGPLTRALLAALAIEAGHMVSVDRLVAELWGEAAPTSARASIQSRLSRVRRLLGPRHQLRSYPHGYAWELEPDQCDLARFRRRAAWSRAPGAASNGALETLAGALDEWRGPALADLRGIPLGDSVGPILDAEHVTARLDHGVLLIRRGDTNTAVQTLASLAGTAPLDERIRSAHIWALAVAGRVPEALTAYDRWRRLLAGTLGTSPSASLQRLHTDLLRGAIDVTDDHGIGALQQHEARRGVRS